MLSHSLKYLVLFWISRFWKVLLHHHKEMPHVCIWHQTNLSASDWQPPLTHMKLQHQSTTYWHMAYFGRHLTHLFLMTPQGFGYQTFLDWRACPCHTAHKPGECDRSRLGLRVYRSLSLCSGKCHTASPLHLTIHQQAPGKLLCNFQWRGSMAREHHSCKQSRKLLQICCLQELDQWALYSRV